ncbi:uncharacterized protein [Temnothorax nylanderi]|uniref:uncharacterized protein n=1 Tax=Temnothorax nylanderi TaxID=102681 RepID=UPI003A83E3F9
MSESHDIIFLAETLLNPLHSFSIPGFKIIRQDRDTGRQGIALLIRNSINFTPINLDNILKTDDSVEAIGVKISVNNTSTALFGIYRHPIGVCPQRTWQRFFNLANSFPQSLLLGDLNAHHPYWGASSPNSAGHVIMDLLDRFPFTLLNPNTPTFIPPPGITPSLIDLVIASCNLVPLLNTHVLNDTRGSDHRPIGTTVNAKIKTNCIFSHKYKLTKIQLRELASSLESKTQEIETLVLRDADNEPLKQYDSFIDSLQKVVDSISLPSNTPRTCNRNSIQQSNNSHQNPPPAPWWNAECEEAVKARSRACRTYRRNPTVNNFQVYRNQVTTTRKTLRTAKREGWKNYCNSLDFMTPTPSIWKMIKRFRNRKLAPSEDSSAIREFPEAWSHSLVYLIPKPHGKGARPIALTSCLLKLLEKMILNRIHWCAESGTSNLIPDHQFGFRKFRSCSDNLTILNAEIHNNNLLNKTTVALFIDIKGAFDNVIPPILVDDLVQANFPPKTCQFVQNLITERIVQFVIQVHFGNDIITPTNTVRFLGIILDPQLTGAQHMDAVINKARKVADVISALRGVWWGSHPQLLLNIYRAVLRGYIEYASHIFSLKSSPKFHRLEIIQNKAIRACLGYRISTPINTMFAEAKEPPLRLRLQHLASKYLIKSLSITNHPVIEAMFQLAITAQDRPPDLEYCRKKFPLLDLFLQNPQASSTEHISPGVRPDHSRLHSLLYGWLKD